MVLPVFMIAAVSVPALAPGDRFPHLKGEFLTGRTAVLPEVASGRIALLALGFTYESRSSVEAWISRFRRDFTGPDVTFFEVPMIGGMARTGKWFIDRGMRRGTPRADQENVITVYGGSESWKERLKFQKAGAAHLILLDQTGVVRWIYAGGFNEQAFGELSREVSALKP